MVPFCFGVGVANLLLYGARRVLISNKSNKKKEDWLYSGGPSRLSRSNGRLEVGCQTMGSLRSPQAICGVASGVLQSRQKPGFQAGSERSSYRLAMKDGLGVLRSLQTGDGPNDRDNSCRIDPEPSNHFDHIAEPVFPLHQSFLVLKRQSLTFISVTFISVITPLTCTHAAQFESCQRPQDQTKERQLTYKRGT